MSESVREATTEELKQKMDEALNTYKSIKDTLDKREELEKKKKQDELKQQRDARRDEVDKAYDTWVELVRAFVKDYGSYSRHTRDFKTTNDDWEDFWEGFGLR